MANIINRNETPNLKNSGLSAAILNNPAGYKVLILISMLYMSIMLCNAILTNRYIGTNALFVLGGTFTSPFIFILDDIIAEIYGYKITRFIIITGFICQTGFALLSGLVTALPHPTFFKESSAYTHILGSSLLRIDISGFLAYITANLINSYIITRWKVLLKGKRFWLRSISSSAFSEALYSFIAILMMELQSVSLQNIFKIIFLSY